MPTDYPITMGITSGAEIFLTKNVPKSFVIDQGVLASFTKAITKGLTVLQAPFAMIGRGKTIELSVTSSTAVLLFKNMVLGRTTLSIVSTTVSTIPGMLKMIGWVDKSRQYVKYAYNRRFKKV